MLCKPLDETKHALTFLPVNLNQAKIEKSGVHSILHLRHGLILYAMHHPVFDKTLTTLIIFPGTDDS